MNTTHRKSSVELPSTHSFSTTYPVKGCVCAGGAFKAQQSPSFPHHNWSLCSRKATYCTKNIWPAFAFCVSVAREHVQGRIVPRPRINSNYTTRPRHTDIRSQAICPGQAGVLWCWCLWMRWSQSCWGVQCCAADQSDEGEQSSETTTVNQMIKVCTTRCISLTSEERCDRGQSQWMQLVESIPSWSKDLSLGEFDSLQATNEGSFLLRTNMKGTIKSLPF